MTRTKPLLALVPMLAVALAACGTTLDDKDFTLAQGQRGSVTNPDGSGATSTDGSGTSGAVTNADGSVTNADGSVTAPGGSTSSGTTGGTGSSGTKSSASAAPLKSAPKAVDAALAPVEVGVLYYPDANANAAKFGANVDFGDPQSQTNATLAYLNANGGFAGHKVIPVFSPIQTTDTTPYATLEQQVCDQWTQDHHVVAGIVVGNVPPAIQQCMNERKAVILATGNYMHDTTDYATWPFMVNPAEVSSNNQDIALVESLVKRGFFKADDKIGVFYEDYPASKRAYDSALVPTLKKHGLTVTDSFAGHFPESTSELGGALASLQTPTLKFKAEGITKVLFAGTGEMGTVMQYAESNSYHPQYGFTSNETPNTRESNQVAHTQLPGSMGVGWVPLGDITVNPPADNANGLKCLDIMKPISGANSAASKFSAFHYCGSLLFLAAGAAQNPQTTFTGDALRQGTNKLGSSFTHPYSTATSISANHRAGATQGQDMAYDTGCFCFKYTSAPYAIG